MAKSRRREARGSARDAGIRGARLEQLFREELNSVFETEIGDPVLQTARVTRVELARDGVCARVWFALVAATGELSSLRPTNEEPMNDHDRPGGSARAASAMRRLQGAVGFLRYRLCDALPLKRTPELKFYLDPLPLAPGGAGDEEHVH